MYVPTKQVLEHLRTNKGSLQNQKCCIVCSAYGKVVCAALMTAHPPPPPPPPRVSSGVLKTPSHASSRHDPHGDPQLKYSSVLWIPALVERNIFTRKWKRLQKMW